MRSCIAAALHVERGAALFYMSMLYAVAVVYSIVYSVAAVLLWFAGGTPTALSAATTIAGRAMLPAVAAVVDGVASDHRHVRWRQRSCSSHA